MTYKVLNLSKPTTAVLYLNAVMDYLYSNEIQSLIIEGGSITINHFLEANLWDEARIFTAPIILEKGVAAPLIKEHKQQQLQKGLTILKPR